MPIIIPPKNIFEIDNKIVRNNVINRIEVKAYDATKKNENDVSVFNQIETNIDFPDYASQWLQQGTELYDATSDAGKYVECVYIALRPTYKTITVRVPKIIDTTLILAVLHSFELQDTIDESGNTIQEKIPDIKYTLYLEQKVQDASYQYQGKSGDDENYGTKNFTLGTPEMITTIPSSQVKTNITATKLNPFTSVTPEGYDIPKAEITFTDETTVIDPNYSKTTDYYELTFKVFVGYEQYILQGKSNKVATGWGYEIEPFWLNGYRYDYKPQKIEINIYGSTLSVDLNETTQNVYEGEVNKDSTNLFSIDRNELLQTTNTYNGLNAIENNYTKVINHYKNGKETATLLCSVDNYYDENGNEIISIKKDKPMLFKRHDIVIPYIGKDKPMSTYSDGTPKSFMVLKSRIFSKGVVWQELTIQEISK